jgi:dienelactone hydrolase
MFKGGVSMFRQSLPTCLALLLALALALVLACGPVAAQRLRVEPAATVLVGTPLAIVASGLAPAAVVALRTQRGVREWNGQRQSYQAEARYVADAQGRVDLAVAVPQSGSYTGADVQGLFWSAAPTRDASPVELGDEQVRLSLHVDGREADVTTLTLNRQAGQVRTTPVPEFPGAVLASLPGAVPRPVIIALGGSEGGSLSVRRAAGLWASMGYAVLALPYYSPGGWDANGPTPPELPQLPAAFAEIPVDRLESARAWLQRQPGVDATRIGLLGVSKGAEFALLAATKMPWIRAVVAVVPSDVVWEGWGPGVPAGQKPSFSWQGQPLPFVPYVGFAQEMQGFATGSPVRIRRPQDAGRAAHPQAAAAARIPVEAYAGPVLLIAGGDDQVWDSGGMAQSIAASRQAAGRETLTLIYPDAGHALSGPGWSPTTTFNAGPMKMGGRPEADGRAMADAWPKTQAFLRRALGPVPD